MTFSNLNLDPEKIWKETAAILHANPKVIEAKDNEVFMNQVMMENLNVKNGDNVSVSTFPNIPHAKKIKLKLWYG